METLKILAFGKNNYKLKKERYLSLFMCIYTTIMILLIALSPLINHDPWYSGIGFAALLFFTVGWIMIFGGYYDYKYTKFFKTNNREIELYYCDFSKYKDVPSEKVSGLYNVYVGNDGVVMCNQKDIDVIDFYRSSIFWKPITYQWCLNKLK